MSAVWYAARSGGIVAYLALTASVVVGLLLSGRVSLEWPRFAVTELHRYLGLVAGVFIGLHGALLLLDTVQPLSLGQELVPFSSSYRPLAVGLGVVAAELMAAVGISNALRNRIPYSVWRRIHFLTLVVWVLASAHLVLAGTDRGEPWLVGLVAGSWCAAALAGSVRLLAPWHAQRLRT